MSGTIHQIDVRRNGTLLLYNDIDTSPGQSGSPIYLKRGSELTIIGVHVGYDSSMDCNIGTAMTFEKF